MKITYEPIGVIHSPFKDLVSMPIQPTSESSAAGRIEIYTPFMEGLKDLEGFSHIILLFHLHQARGTALMVIPFLDSTPRGVFATRAPNRPNPIGLSVVKLIQIKDAILHVEELDVLDGTPLLDIKPYIPEVDNRPGARIGWFERVKGDIRKKVSDDRFS